MFASSAGNWVSGCVDRWVGERVSGRMAIVAVAFLNALTAAAAGTNAGAATATAAGTTALSAAHSHFVLTSSDPQLAVSVPVIYTAKAFGCSGGNLSPELHWSGAPAETQSFVVTLFDRDERSTPSGWWHWVLYDLPTTVTSLPQGAGALHSTAIPAAALEGRTDLGEDAYHGPCPAKGDPPHRYVFTVYALKVAKLPVPADSSGAMVTSTLQEYLLAKAVFVAHYGRP
jgi:Raf kinase inhibitor-like YbhB/YbcL family protein